MSRWNSRDLERLRARARLTSPTSRAREKAQPAGNGALDLLIRRELVRAAGQTVGLGEPVSEHRFVAGRLFRLDFAWPPQRIGLEIEGGVYTRGVGHTSVGAILRDMEKSNFWTSHGWRVFRLTPEQLHKGKLAEWLQTMRAQLGAIA